MDKFFEEITFDLNALYFLLHILTGVLLLAALKWFFPTLGTGKKAVDARSRWSSQLKPTLGGILFITALIILCAYTAIASQMNSQLTGLLIASVVVFALGLWDDIARITPRQKLAGQFVGAVCFAACGNSAHIASAFISDPSVLSTAIDFALTVFLAVAFMNSVNMMDNMDSAAAISVLPAFLILGSTSLNGSLYPFDILTASLIAFLLLNWHPSRVFMGDSGSMVLGLIVAFSVLTATNSSALHNGSTPVNFFVSVFTLGTVLISDTLLVIFQRRRHGISPMQGGRDHTTHHLFYTGLSQREVAVLLFFLNFIPLIIHSTMIRLEAYNHFTSTAIWRIAPLMVYFILYFSLMIFISNRNLRLGKYTYSK